MPQKRRTSTFDLGNDLTVAMDRLFDRDGITPSEQVRRALVPFLERRGVLKKKPKKSERQPASTRQRPIHGLR